VAQVDEDPESAHLLHKGDPEIAETSVALLPAAVPGGVPVVVCDLDDPDAVIVCDLEELRVSFKEAAVLGPEDDTVSPLLLGLRDGGLR
jgi:hypothetical protein